MHAYQANHRWSRTSKEATLPPACLPAISVEPPSSGTCSCTGIGAATTAMITTATAAITKAANRSLQPILSDADSLGKNFEVALLRVCSFLFVLSPGFLCRVTVVR